MTHFLKLKLMQRSASKSSGLDHSKRTGPPWAFATGSRFLALGNISSGIMTIIIIFAADRLLLPHVDQKL